MSGSSVTQAIKARLNILDIVRRYVDLRRTGNRWFAPCPFHQEKSPSFSVNEEEGFFYCFGCQAAGDIFDFYGRINGLDFKDTLEALAEEAGVTIKDARPDPKADAARNLRKAALRMYDLARTHFRKNLFTPSGASCREYLERRKISPEICEEFELGWALPEWQGLADALRSAGFSARQGIDAGLLAANERGSGYDRFRGRLIFPIKNLSGQVIAFGGRIIGGEDGAKYINSTDSPIYKKGDNLYGLFQARRSITVKKTAILTEGYMDVLTLHQFGYTNSCAALGTALTDEQIRRLAGFTSHLELIFDGDPPGRKAALRACEMVLTKGLSCKVVLLPEKDDIDSLLHGQGPEAFEEIRQFSPDGLDFCIRSLSREAPLKALEWVKNFLSAIELPELVSPYASRLTQGLDLDEHALRQGLSIPGTSFGAQKNARPRQEQARTNAAPGPQGAFDREIIKFVVRYPHHLPRLREAGAAFLFSERWAATFWDKVEKCAPDFAPDIVLQELDDREKEFWGQYRVMMAPPPDKEQEELADFCSYISKMYMERQDKAARQALIQSGGQDTDMEILKALNDALHQKRKRWSSDG